MQKARGAPRAGKDVWEAQLVRLRLCGSPRLVRRLAPQPRGTLIALTRAALAGGGVHMGVVLVHLHGAVPEDLDAHVVADAGVGHEAVAGVAQAVERLVGPGLAFGPLGLLAALALDAGGVQDGRELHGQPLRAAAGRPAREGQRNRDIRLSRASRARRCEARGSTIGTSILAPVLPWVQRQIHGPDFGLSRWAEEACAQSGGSRPCSSQARLMRVGPSACPPWACRPIPVSLFRQRERA